ncbi:YbaB/EbfC family nucleoid-associated protein [Candidatus Microgenomates bacterium]|nr:YbaB/EbfC family nucleoid-associated protein [Candidatus Microgenomates bacterium]
MFNPLKSLGDIKKLREQAMEMQRQLEAEEIELNKDGVHVKMTGNQKIKELTIDGQEDNRLAEVINEALKKSQEIAARKLAQMGGGLQGLLGK